MHINKIDRVGVVQASLFVLGVTGILALEEYNKNKDINNKKDQIMVNDSIKYNKVSKLTQDRPVQVQVAMWDNAYKEMQDSMQKSGIANKNYVEGIQSAKDSLNK